MADVSVYLCLPKLSSLTSKTFLPSFTPSPLSCFLAVRNFVLIPQHTSPDSALEETDALYDVVIDVRRRWNTNVNPFLHLLHILSHTSSGGVQRSPVVKYESGQTVQISLQDIVLLGDFNAGCSYVTGSEWEQIRLFTDKSFHWLITNEADTTVSQTNCPYDR